MSARPVPMKEALVAFTEALCRYHQATEALREAALRTRSHAREAAERSRHVRETFRLDRAGVSPARS